jgi:hypothetical protein
MKLTKTASGKQTIKMSQKEWTSIGQKAGWIKQAFFGLGNKLDVITRQEALGTIPIERVVPQKVLNKMTEEQKGRIKMFISYQGNNPANLNGLMSRFENNPEGWLQFAEQLASNSNPDLQFKPSRPEIVNI